MKQEDTLKWKYGNDLNKDKIQSIISTPKTSFIDCEYRIEEYCTNPKRKDKNNTIALFFCQKSDCKLNALKRWW